MTRTPLHLLATVFALTLSTLVGCQSEREPLLTVEPNYSWVKDGTQREAHVIDARTGSYIARLNAE